MKKIKKLIITLIVVIIILLIIRVVFVILNKKDGIGGDLEFEPIISGEIENVVDTPSIALVESCIERYYTTLNKNSFMYYTMQGEEIEKTSDTEINKRIIDMLSKEYVNKNNINVSNLDEHINKLEEDVNVVSTEMKVLLSDSVQKYFVSGKIVNSDYALVDDFCMYVNIDIYNKTFSIEPLRNNTNGANYSNNNESIEVNDNNQYEEIAYEYDDIIYDIMYRYSVSALLDVEESYNNIDEEYRSKKFNDIDEYKKYIELNKENIKNSIIEKYKVNYTDDYIEYTCVDQFGLYYIIKEKSLLDYTILLDNYTINPEEFITKYNEGSNKLKAGMNLEKISQAINKHDYEYIYNKLDPTFRQNNFSTIESFEQYIKENFYEMNKFTYEDFEEKGGVCIFKVKVTNSYTNTENTDDEEDVENEEIAESKDKSFIVKLGNETDFTFSFDLNN